jgi:uncharacterized membrane protein YecN with MAPEG domain
MPVTPLFIAIFALIYIVLAMGVMRHRLGSGISLGSGDHDELERSVRAHANFAEYVPIALLLLWALETISYDGTMAFILGCVLLVGRILHVIGILDPQRFMLMRKIGIVVTFVVLLIGSLRLIWHYLPVQT